MTTIKNTTKKTNSQKRKDKLVDAKQQMMKAKENKEKTKKNMLKVFATICQKLQRVIKTSEMNTQGYHNLPVKINPYYTSIDHNGKSKQTLLTRNSFNHYFVNKAEFVKEAMVSFPSMFDNVIEHDVYIPKAMAKVEKIVDKANRFVIITAIADAKPHKNSLKALKKWAKKKKYKILLIPADNRFSEIDKAFHNDPDIHVVFGDLKLNNSVFISNVKVQPSVTSPLTGLSSWTQRYNSSIIVGSPKLCLEDVPCVTGRGKPHRLMTTGAITQSNYKSNTRLSLKKNAKAEQDHVLSALIIEIEKDNEDVYYNRHIEFESNGSFTDLGVRYTPTGAEQKIKEAVFVLGDLHSIGKNEKAFKHFVEKVAPKLAPSGKVEIYIHDFFDGESISHHDQHRMAKCASLSIEDRLSFNKELRQCAEDLKYLTSKKHISRVKIVASNHDDFANRWLDDKRFVADKKNNLIGCKLFDVAVASYLHRSKPVETVLKLIAEDMCMTVEAVKKNFPNIVKKKTPIQVGVEQHYLYPTDKVDWMELDKSQKKYGIELAFHGHHGSGGARMNSKTAGNFLGKAITGHTHTANISPNSLVWTVGCLEHLHPEYAKGGNSWSHTSIVAYPSGKRQLLTLINGKCFLDDKRTV